jgi:hypothetical protein
MLLFDGAGLPLAIDVNEGRRFDQPLGTGGSKFPCRARVVKRSATYMVPCGAHGIRAPITQMVTRLWAVARGLLVGVR